MDQPTPSHRTDDRSPRSSRRVTSKQTTAGGVALALLVTAYSFAQPMLNERMGWNLPGISPPGQPHSERESTTNDGKTFQSSQPPVVAAKSATGDQVATSPRPSQPPVGQTSKPGPLAGRVPKPKAQTEPTPAQPKSAPSKTTTLESNKPKEATVSAEDSADLLHGILKDLGGERYVSAAGLMYTRGSAEGHRLNHLERHTEDDPSRPGKHGVFDGGMKGALATIDRAYQRAKTGTRTTKEMDQGRTVYTVDMGARVGYIGGRDGNRQKKPMARRVRIVLDQNRVITAYPL